MKKLMMTAAAVALAGVATASNVFDYKASVKYVDMKYVSYSGSKVLVKTVKSTSVKGYLVTPQNCACEAACAAREPGFLVVTTSLAKKYDKDHQVKLMPANLLADMWATKSIAGTAKSATLEAQGYLFAGLGKSDMPAPAGSPAYGFGDLETCATQYLFGYYDDLDTNGQFIEPFLDAAGFGKAGYSSTEWGGCDAGRSGGYCLKSLSGSVIGGSWTCFANAFVEGWRCQGWNNEAIAAGTDYSGYDYLYNVISGTWSIKENTKIEAAGLTVLEDALLDNASGTASYATAQLVKACGQKLQSTFTLVTFDANSRITKAERSGNFVAKWFAPYAAE